MDLKTQKKLAAEVLKCSTTKVVFDPDRLEEIKESITKVDIRNLIKDKAIMKKIENGPSKVRARENAIQKSKGRRRGQGSRKGKYTARLQPKADWMNRIRKIKTLIKTLREKGKLESRQYRVLYNKAKGGAFRSERHAKMYINEMVKNK